MRRGEGGDRRVACLCGDIDLVFVRGRGGRLLAMVVEAVSHLMYHMHCAHCPERLCHAQLFVTLAPICR